MHVTIVTAFPEFFGDFLATSILGRAVKKKLVQVDLVNLRDFGKGGYRQIDDYSFGAGGMVLAAPPLKEALNEAASRGSGKPFVLYPSPQGSVLTQEIVETLAQQEHVVILCGHYEGVDERFIEREVNLEVTVGDCVLTGGEIPAMMVIDAMSRLVPGVVGREEAVAEDSFYRGMLDHPHYTRPAAWEGMDVPEVLLSGNESEIRDWRRSKAIERTLQRRPDLLSRAAIGGYLSGRSYLALREASVPLAPHVICDVAELCRIYSLERPILIIDDPERRRAFDRALPVPEGFEPKIFGSLDYALNWITEREKGVSPLLISVEDKASSGTVHCLELKRRCLEHGGPLFLYFSFEASGMNQLDSKVILTSLTQDKASFPLASRVAVTLDRLMGAR